MSPRSIWLLGAGRLGRRAAESLQKEYPAADITLVDSSPEACGRMEGRASTVICQEGTGFLFQHLKEGRAPDWIVPMIPVHVAYEWMRLKLAKTHRIEPLPVPPEVIEKLPNPIRGVIGRIYMSNANFRCPWNCPEPEDICTYTGKARPAILHRLLERIRHSGFQTIVIQSVQLAPGVGGYLPAALFRMLEKVCTGERRVLLATACRCHGVMDAFQCKRFSFCKRSDDEQARSYFTRPPVKKH